MLENRRKLRKWMQKPQGGGSFTTRSFRCGFFCSCYCRCCCCCCCRCVFLPFSWLVELAKFAPTFPKHSMGNSRALLHPIHPTPQAIINVTLIPPPTPFPSPPKSTKSLTRVYQSVSHKENANAERLPEIGARVDLIVLPSIPIEIQFIP